MYPVDPHTHIVASTHAYSALSDYIVQAKQKGIKLFAITDHGSNMKDTPHHWYLISMRIWSRAVDGVGILRGIEASIKNADGEIDCSDKTLDSLDLIITGSHEPVFASHDKATNMQAMIATIVSGNVHIISHPGNLRYEIDARAVAEAATEYQVTLEINNSSFLHSRKGSEDSHRAIVAVACDAGGWMALGSDSHTVFTTGEFEERLKILDAVDLPSERILNVSPRRLLNSLEFRGMAPIAELTDL